MDSIIIKNGYVVTMDTQRRVFDPGYVKIRGKMISAVGPMSEAPRESGMEKIINAEGHIVIPGLINMHQHHWYNLFKGLGDGMSFEEWLDNLFFLSRSALPTRTWSFQAISPALRCLKLEPHAA